MSAEIVYGRRPVAEAQRGRRRVHEIWEAPATDPAELERLAGSPDHQGIVARVDPYPYADPAALLRDPNALVVACDQIQDPHNLGAICRSAEAAGVAGVVICERRAVGVTAAVCKTSAGAVEHLAVARIRNLADWLVTAREQGAWSYGADAEAERGYAEVDLSGRAVIVIGGEGGGLRPRVRDCCDELISIPTGGVVGSLNASVAAAVLMFSAGRAATARGSA